MSTISSRKRMMSITFLLMLLAVVSLPMTGYLFTGIANAEQQAEQTNPRADVWRQVRNNDAGYSAVKGRETNELIQGSGENWRQLRNGPLALYGSWLLGFTLAALAVFYLWRGSIKLEHPPTGELVERWSPFERRLHWMSALTFIVLAVTGLSLLYGRHVLIPLFGLEGFSAYASIAKWSHNILGPLFVVLFIAMIAKWFKANFFNKIDLEWFKAGGGIIGDAHPSAERLNGGEKLFFWCLAIAGLGLCVSGLILDFPNFNQQREIIQLSHIIHLITALGLIAFTFGHIYIATIGTEGALEGMKTGYVDVAWAQQHHDLWLEQVRKQAVDK
jgi:formate dehydrogenase subunit gamma